MYMYMRETRTSREAKSRVETKRRLKTGLTRRKPFELGDADLNDNPARLAYGRF